MSTQAPPAARGAAPIGGMLPFVAAANEHTEVAFDSGNLAANSTTSINAGPFDVPAYGFIRHIWLEVVISGGTLGAGTLGADYPFSYLSEVALLDVNGAPLVQLTGYQLFLANLVGGYSYRQDPRDWSGYVGTINATFYLRIPVEIAHHSGLGALANQSSAAQYRVRIGISPGAGQFSVAPTTVPTTIRVRGLLEAWSQPSQTDPAGRPQMTAPPSHGTTQFWSAYNRPLTAGQNTIPCVRVGNLIRNLIFVYRDSSGVRQASQVPDPLTLNLDARQLFSEVRPYRLARQGEQYESTNGLPAGVLVYPFDNSVLGKAGDGSPASYLPTVQSTRLEQVGTIAAVGTVEVITNDVAPVEIDPAGRYVETSATGFRPGMNAGPVA